MIYLFHVLVLTSLSDHIGGDFFYEKHFYELYKEFTSLIPLIKFIKYIHAYLSHSKRILKMGVNYQYKWMKCFVSIIYNRRNLAACVIKLS